MLFIIVYLLIIVLHKGHTVAVCSHASLTAMPLSRELGVWKGDSLVLTCRVYFNDTPLQKVPVEFMHGTERVANDCKSVHPRIEIRTCHQSPLDVIHEYELYLHNVTWEDRGDWICYCQDIAATRNINNLLYVPGSLNMHIKPLSPSVSNTSVPEVPLIGNGTQQDPIDLRESPSSFTNASNRGVLLTCNVSCTHPNSPLSWYILSTHNPVPLPSLPTYMSTPDGYQACDWDPNTRDMSQNRSELRIQCTDMKEVRGVFQVVCSTHGPQFGRFGLVEQQNVGIYLICEDLEPESGWLVRAFRSLSRVEVALVSVSGVCLLLVLILVVLCLWSWSRSRNSGYHEVTPKRKAPLSRQHQVTIEDDGMRPFKRIPKKVAEKEQILAANEMWAESTAAHV